MISRGGGRGTRTMPDEDAISMVRRLLAARRRDGLARTGADSNTRQKRASWRVVRRHRQAAAIEDQVARLFAERGDIESASEHQGEAHRERVIADTEELRIIESAADIAPESPDDADA